MIPVNEVIQGDSIKIMKQFPPNSIDTVATDSPYGFGFLNHKWDIFSSMGFLRFSYKWSRIAFNKLKPGSYLLNCAIPKKYHLMACGIELAGFKIKDCIFWCFGDGFPKNLDISKAIDAYYGKEGEVIGVRYRHGGGTEDKYMGMTQDPRIEITKPMTDAAQQWEGWGTGLKPAVEMIIVAQKPYEKTYAYNILKNGIGGLNIDKCRVNYTPHKEVDARIYNPSKNITRGNHENATIKYAPDGNEFAMYKTEKGRWPANLILSHHPECKLIGIKKVGSGKVTHNSEITRKGFSGDGPYNDLSCGFDVNKCQYLANYGIETIEAYDCHPDCPIRLLDQQSGDLGKSRRPNLTGHDYKSEGLFKGGQFNVEYNDKGGASRFFYNAKVYPTERNAGCEHLYWEKKNDTIIPITKEKYEKLPKDHRAKGNPISTLKPINLLRYLVRLVTPPNGVVLDPFAGCYDEQTEILTKEGWKLFKDLTIKDKVASLKEENKELYYINPLEIQKYKYKGKMIKINHRSVNLLITPNHNMYLREHHKQNYEFMKANAIKYETIHFLNSINWKGIEKEFFYLPKVKYHKSTSNYIEKRKLRMDDFLEFLGWYIADGHISKSRYIVAITQTKKDNLKEIGNCLTRLGYKWNFVQNRRFKFGNKQLYEYLIKLGKTPQKYIPLEFMDLSKRQLKILFNALVKGDGHTRKSGRIHYFTISKKLAGQIQELAIKLGYNSTLRTRLKKKAFSKKYNSFIEGQYISYEIDIRKRKECQLRKSKHISKQKYEGYVYCCTVPTHILCIRRNGRPTWCGNSGTTGIACLIEGFKYILIEERDPFANIIIPHRLEYWKDPDNWALLKDHNILPKIKKLKYSKQNHSITEFIKSK